jgi:hypothetical protein
MCDGINYSMFDVWCVFVALEIGMFSVCPLVRSPFAVVPFVLLFYVELLYFMRIETYYYYRSKIQQ